MNNVGVSIRTGQAFESAPSAGRDEERPHKCGRCNNGTGVFNPECPNARNGDKR